MIIRPAKRIRGRLRMPGDKSISHRAALIAALANGTSHIRNFSSSEDCAATLQCLRQLKVPIAREGKDVSIEGTGASGLRAASDPLDCGNSGTTMRLLAGILAGRSFASTMIGDQSLQSRPMRRIIEPLQMMGAQISSNEHRAPLIIQGRTPLRSIEYEMPVASAQVKSCILFAGLNAAGRTKIIEHQPTRDHTERMLRWFGATVETGVESEGRNFTAVSGPTSFSARDVEVPGDISSAVYFIAAAMLLDGSSLEIEGVGLNPTRSMFLSLFKSFGFEIDIDDVGEESNEPVGNIRVRGSRPAQLAGNLPIVCGPLVSGLIDELPLVAVMGTQIEGGIEIRGAAELRVKESDRIAVTVAGLRAMGAEAEEFQDGMRVTGRTRLHGAEIDPRGDHRIAMAFTVAALVAQGETRIRDADCVAVSFPEFFALVDSVVE